MTEYMNGVVTGVVAGLLVVSGVVLVGMVKHLITEMSFIKIHIVTMLGLMMKMDRTTQATMAASEGFIDGLRQSTEQMNGPMGGPPFMRNKTDHFQDLRNRFEEGINRLENEDDDDDEDEEDRGPTENWKK